MLAQPLGASPPLAGPADFHWDPAAEPLTPSEAVGSTATRAFVRAAQFLGERLGWVSATGLRGTGYDRDGGGAEECAQAEQQVKVLEAGMLRPFEGVDPDSAE